MHYIKKLPFLIALLATILVGIISYSKNIDLQQIYLRMALCLGIFILPEMLYKSTLSQLENEVDTKNQNSSASGNKNSASAEKVRTSVEDPLEKDTLVRSSKTDFTLDSKSEEKIDSTKDKGEEAKLDTRDEFSPWDLNDIINYKVQKK